MKKVDGGSRKEDRSSITSRRETLLDAAIEVLALEGPRGFTHREIDRYAGLPQGSATNFYSRRDTLLTATAERLIELDILDFEAAVAPLYDSEVITREQLEQSFTKLYFQWSRQEYQVRARARLEITTELVRNDILRGTTSHLIGDIQQRFLMLFKKLDSSNDEASASRFNYILQGLHLIIVDNKFPLTERFLNKIISEYLVIALSAE